MRLSMRTMIFVIKLCSVPTSLLVVLGPHICPTQCLI